jgi:hypothetical protein
MVRNWDIHNEPCNCEPGQCASYVEDDAHCINRLSGDVQVQDCAQCGGLGTWHQNGECLRCRRMRDGA